MSPPQEAYYQARIRELELSYDALRASYNDLLADSDALQSQHTQVCRELARAQARLDSLDDRPDE